MILKIIMQKTISNTSKKYTWRMAKMNRENSRFERFASIAKSYIESIKKFARGE